MLYLKEGYPEVNEIVKCTVKKIYGNSVFVNLDEYDKEGVIVISEVSPGRIRNIRDFVVENKTIICKVLRVNEHRKHIDVSLRRVPVPVMKEKIDQLKMEDFAEKIYMIVSEKLGITKDELLEKTYEVIFDKHENIYNGLKGIAENPENISIFTSLTDKEREVFKDAIINFIKPKEIVVKKTFNLISYESDGISNIKKIIADSKNNMNFEESNVYYLAAGKYQIKVSHKDLKTAHKLVDGFIDFIDKNQNKYSVNLSVK